MTETVKLPNSDRAVVDIAKLRDYCLNPGYEDGRHKARVFASALGIRQGQAEWLRDRLLEAAVRDDGVMVSKIQVWDPLRARLFGGYCVGLRHGAERMARAIL